MKLADSWRRFRRRTQGSELKKTSFTRSLLQCIQLIMTLLHSIVYYTMSLCISVWFFLALPISENLIQFLWLSSNMNVLSIYEN